MKRINLIILIILLTTMCFAAWDKTKPSSSTSLRSSNPEILANWDALETAIAQDHTFATGSPDGKHTQITFTDPISTPSDVTNEGVVYTKDASSVVELHWKDESGNELQYTSDGNLFSSTGLIVTNESTFNNHINLGSSDDLLLSTTSDIIISGNTFTVAGATGNIVVAGTLDVTGILTTTAASVLGDGSLLAAATESGDGDRVIADKGYIDDQIAASVTMSSITTVDSESNTLIVSHAYLAATDGFVNATSDLIDDNEQLIGYVDTDSDPVSGGTKLAIQEADTANEAQSISFSVASGEYFEVTCPSTTAIYWRSMGTLSAPVDQD